MFPVLRCLALSLSFLYAAQVAAADLAHPRTYCLGRLFEETLAQAQAGDLQASRQAVMLLQECDPSSPHIGSLLEYGAKHDDPDLTLGYIHHLEPVQSLASEGETRRKRLKKRSGHGVHEHFEVVFNKVSPQRSRLGTGS